MIALFQNIQDTGKTASMVATALELVANHGYSGKEVIGNLTVRIPGYTKYTNTELREYIKNMVKKGYKHKVIMIDEVDGVFPARLWHQAEQTDTLLGFWQDFKLFNWILMTGHGGPGADLIIRSTTLIVVEPKYIKGEDTIYLTIYNGIKRAVLYDSIYPASSVFKRYNRWQPIK